jgi:hypothetical protein
MDEKDSKKLIKQQFYQYQKSWRNSFINGFSVDENDQPIPWFSYKAIDFIKNFIQKNHHICEYGCGSSTLFFSQRAEYLVGLETNPIWLKIIEQKIIEENFKHDQKLQSLQLNNAPKLVEKFYKNFFRNSQQINLYLNENAMQDDDYQNFCNYFLEKFDIIIIDSKKRFSCAKQAIQGLKSDGIIILDDSQRSNYQKIFQYFEQLNFKKIDFFGIAPGQLTLKNTTIFYK